MKAFAFAFAAAAAVAAVLSVAAAAPAGAAADCWAAASTQREAAFCALSELKASEERMQSVYEAIRRRHANDSKLLAKMRLAQERWRAFRDAYIASVFPEEDDPLAAYGSAYAMCRASQLALITDQRTEQLRAWIDGVEEGDICSGSRPTTFD